MKLAVVDNWLEAVNDADADRLIALTTERVEIVGPRGAGPADREVLAAWLARSGFSATSLRWFCGANGEVVVEQQARWAAGGDARLASRFHVDGGRVSRYVRHDDGLAPALAAAGLSLADEVPA